MSKFYIIFAMLCCWGCARPREQVFKNSLLATEETQDEICEAVVRWIDRTQTNACYFVGFEDTTRICDIPDLNLVSQPIGQDGGHLIVKPISATIWQPPWIPEETRSVVVGHEVSRKGVRCTLWGLKLISKDEAEVHARFKAGGIVQWSFHLRHQNSAWRVLDGGPTTAF